MPHGQLPQAPLWPMAGLLRDLDPPKPWMKLLRLNDLNFWLGDGHFRNTLHYDPFDNFLCQAHAARRPHIMTRPLRLARCLELARVASAAPLWCLRACQVRGTKHVLLYPPEAKEELYYANRRDIQARYQPSRGEYGRFDTGIVSENTAAINGANPDLAAHPKFENAVAMQSYASLGPADCLYLPNGWHHHVFSEADTDSGYNLALNLWISREATLAGVPPRPDYKSERFPTIRQVGSALRSIEPEAESTAADGDETADNDGECNVSDG
jgi:hypothetical protein